MSKHPIIRAAFREARRLIKEPRYLLILTAGIVFTFIFFATITGEGQPQRLPVAVVDLDSSYLSRRLCHELDATSGVHVRAVYTYHAQVRQAMQRGEIFAYYEIPAGTYNRLLQFLSPQLVLYYNSSYLLAGTLCYKQMATMGMLAAGAVLRGVYRKKGYDEEQIMGLIQPVTFETHNISNPWINYGIYLMTTLIPAVIAFIALMHTAYSIVRERQERRVKSWVKKTGGNTLYALIGKMAPYTIWYSGLALLANLIMFSVMNFPMYGSWPALVVCTVMLIVGAQCAGAMIACCLPDPPLAMSVCALYSAMSFSLSGFSFPIESMPRFFTGFSWLYPIRHYFLGYRDIAIYGGGMEHCWPYVCALLAFCLLPIIGAAMLNWQIRKEVAQ